MRLSILLTCLVAGCANGYGKFYESTIPEVGFASQFELLSEDPKIVPGYGDIDGTIRKMFERGYGLVGYASFNGPLEKEKKALNQAQKIGANEVVLLSEYTDTATGTFAVHGSKQQTAYHTGTVSTYGSGGMTFGNYSGTSTTSIPTTTYIPYSIRRYDQTALFFAPMRASCLGILTQDPSIPEMRLAGTNNVIKVSAVREGSAADIAEILPGDLLSTTEQSGINPKAHSFGLEGGVLKTVHVLRGHQWYQTDVIPQNCE